MTRLRRLDGLRELLAVTGQDTHIRAIVDPQRVHSTWAHADGAAAWVASSSRLPRRIHVTTYGFPRSAAELVVALREDVGIAATAVTLPRGADEHLPSSYVLRAREDWEWFATTDRPPAQPGESEVQWLHEPRHDELTAFLERWSPRHDAKPGGTAVLRWCGVRGARGELIAVAAHVEYMPGVPHLASIATSGEHRGRGHGAAVTAWLTRTLLDEGNALVTLGMYSDNDVARRIYLRLGYRREHEFTSGGLIVRDNVAGT